MFSSNGSSIYISLYKRPGFNFPDLARQVPRSRHGAPRLWPKLWRQEPNPGTPAVPNSTRPPLLHTMCAAGATAGKRINAASGASERASAPFALLGLGWPLATGQVSESGFRGRRLLPIGWREGWGPCGAWAAHQEMSRANCLVV